MSGAGLKFRALQILRRTLAMGKIPQAFHKNSASPARS